MWTDILGYAAGTVTAICFVPQIVQTIRTKCADDISFWMLFLTLLSVGLYVIYAMLLGIWPVVIMNGLCFGLVTFELYLKLYFSKPFKRIESRAKVPRDQNGFERDGSDERIRNERT